VHVRELFDPAERAAPLAQLDDRPSLRGTDPRQLLEQLRTGAVDVDRKQIDRDDLRRGDRLGAIARRFLGPDDPQSRTEEDAERDEEQDVPLLARHGRLHGEGAVRPWGYRCRISFP
jgi:hypothetical protein